MRAALERREAQGPCAKGPARPGTPTPLKTLRVERFEMILESELERDKEELRRDLGGYGERVVVVATFIPRFYADGAVNATLSRCFSAASNSQIGKGPKLLQLRTSTSPQDYFSR